MPTVQAFFVEANEQRPARCNPCRASRRAAAAGDGRLHPLLITLRAATVVYCSLLCTNIQRKPCRRLYFLDFPAWPGG